MNLNLKPYLKRELDGDPYYIPVELIDRFDELKDKLAFDESETDYIVWEAIGEEYDQYIVEGNMSHIVMWINPDDLT